MSDLESNNEEAKAEDIRLYKEHEKDNTVPAKNENCTEYSVGLVCTTEAATGKPPDDRAENIRLKDLPTSEPKGNSGDGQPGTATADTTAASVDGDNISSLRSQPAAAHANNITDGQADEIIATTDELTDSNEGMVSSLKDSPRERSEGNLDDGQRDGIMADSNKLTDDNEGEISSLKDSPRAKSEGNSDDGQANDIPAATDELTEDNEGEVSSLKDSSRAKSKGNSDDGQRDGIAADSTELTDDEGEVRRLRGSPRERSEGNSDCGQRDGIAADVSELTEKGEVSGLKFLPPTVELESNLDAITDSSSREAELMKSENNSSNVRTEESIGGVHTTDNEDAKQTKTDDNDITASRIGMSDTEYKNDASTRLMTRDNEYQNKHDKVSSDSSSIHSNSSQKHDNDRETSATPTNNDNRSSDIGVETNNDGSIINECSNNEDNHHQKGESVESVRGSYSYEQANEDQRSDKGVLDSSTVSGRCDSDYSGTTVSDDTSLEIVSDIDRNSNSTMESMTGRQTRHKPDTVRKARSNRVRQKKHKERSAVQSSDTSSATEVPEDNKDNPALIGNDSSGNRSKTMETNGRKYLDQNNNQEQVSAADATPRTEVGDTKDTNLPAESSNKDDDIPKTQDSTKKCDDPSTSEESDTSARKDGQLYAASTEETTRSDETVTADSEMKSSSEKNTEESNNSPQGEKRRRRVKPKSVKSIIKKELKLQLSTYINEDRRLLAFDPKGEQTTSSSHREMGTKKRKACLKKNAELKLKIDPATPVSANELNRLVNTAGKMLNEAELEDIWNFHQFRVGKKLDRSPRNGYVQNYSRHFGSILRSSQYQQFYGGLYNKPSHNEKQTTE